MRLPPSLLLGLGLAQVPSATASTASRRPGVGSGWEDGARSAGQPLACLTAAGVGVRMIV